MSSHAATNAPRLPLALMILAGGLGPGSLNLFLPSVPGVATAFASDYATAQLTVSGYLAGMALSPLFAGPLADRFGRRAVLIGSPLGFAILSLLCVLAPDIWTLIGLRVAQAAVGGAAMIAVIAAIVDRHGAAGSGSVLSIVIGGAAMIATLSTPLGGVLEEAYGWRGGVWLLTVIGCLSAGWAFAAMPETGQRGVEGKASPLADFARLMADRSFRAFTLQSALAQCVYTAFIAGAPFVAITLLGSDPSTLGLWFVLVTGSHIFGNVINATLARRLAPRQLIGAGFALGVLAALVLLVVTLAGALSVLVLFGLVAVASFANAFILPNATAAAVAAQPGRAGSASGLTGFIGTVLGAGASLTAGALQGAATTGLPTVTAIALALTLGALMFLGQGRAPASRVLHDVT